MKTVLDEWSKETNPIAYSDFLFKQNEDLRKQIERLQEQLNEANEVMIKCRAMLEEEPESTTVIEDKVWLALENHLAKWGVK